MSLRSLLLALSLGCAAAGPASASQLHCNIPGGSRVLAGGPKLWIVDVAVNVRPETLSSADWRDWSIQGTFDRTLVGPSSTVTQTPLLIEITSSPLRRAYQNGEAPWFLTYTLRIDRQTLVATFEERIEPSEALFSWTGACIASPAAAQPILLPGSSSADSVPLFSR